MAKPADPGALIEQRRAAQAERLRLAEARWTRFQAASRARYGARARRRAPPALARQLARAKTPGRILLLQMSGLWEPGLETSLGVMPGPTATLTDYVRAGPDPTAQPRALFDQSWYLAGAPGIADSRWALLAHYLVVGDGHNLSPHPLLDAPAYRARHGARMRVARLTALEHFLFEGAAAGANPHPLFDLRYYVGQSDAVAASGENPLVHYLRSGWREGLEPHPLFAGTWYLEHYPAAKAAGVAPLLHYVTSGAAEGLDPHPLFDTAHYRKQRHGAPRADALSDFLANEARTNMSPTPHFRPDFYLEQVGDRRPQARANPLLHYLTAGSHEGLWPAPDFDETAYFLANLEAAASPLSGLDHWARNRTARPKLGAAAGHALSADVLFRELRRASDPDPEAYGNAAYETLRPRRTSSGSREPVRVVAIRRSDRLDWGAAARALPNFRGHLQPRLTLEGFVDPADPAVLRRDVALAERYGLGGFCHEVASAAAVEAVTAAAFPFCLAWTGADGPTEAVAAMAPVLGSKHAIRIDGRPVVLVGPGADAPAWRHAADLFLVQRGGLSAPGFDAHLPEILAPRTPEGPPGPVINPDFRGLVHDHLAITAERIAQPLVPDAFPLVAAGYDTTPLSQDTPVIWQGACPGALQAWLEAASDAVAGRPADRRLVFLHAWNDWEAGAAISPDLRFGHGWLEAVRNAADADLLAPPQDEPDGP